ncbi:ABC transporter permease [Hydrogenoanaerobacterium sp.]|uniref:ABC transporter permease n=1 Tax=Hydrogenoanaerobacterium sp. TaxID=2953763 RepID=UPI00289BA6AD|nr:ABC transporter permease [Hydrogenoanaerobacterium sp.]
MNKFFYPRLACTNIKKNKSIYLPYLLAGTLIVALFYILSSITIMVSESHVAGGGTMGAILQLSSWVCGFLSLIILFYINSFIMKRRKKEFGLYSILGMEKRHISIVMLWEVAISGAISIICGIAGGALFSQLLFLLLLKIVGLPAALTFQIPLSSIVSTGILFGLGFVAILVFDIVGIIRSDPIALLHSTKEGEREPKARWLLALIGAVTLGGGYGLSWMVQTPSDAVAAFFFAVMLVIIGTYCLFIAGSIVVLKLLRKNKKFYYQSKNFISVSGMIYRMKQNATGLANICILSTCVLVTLSSTVCLFIGEEDILRSRFPRQVQVTCIADEQNTELVEATANSHAQEYGFTIENAVGYTSFSCATKRNNNTFDMSKFYGADTYELDMILLEDYNRITGASEQLKDDQILIYSSGKPLKEATITLNDQSYEVAGTIPNPTFISSIGMGERLTVVVPALADLEQFRDSFNRSYGGENERNLWYDYKFDVLGDSNRLPDYYATMRSAFNEAVPRLGTVDNIDSARNDFYQVYGSMLFVGIFFVTLFLIAAVLIIYYKQITEGFDDHERFQIMQKVGMSDKEVRSTIQKQVLMVFFLPLGMAVLHITVAFRVLCKMLVVFNMTNTTLFLLCTIGAVLVFTVLYFVVYQLTARTYYRIVQGKV